VDESAELSFESFVRARWAPLVRRAYLLTLDEGKAEDLVQTSLVKLWSAWRRVGRENPEGYVQRILVTSAASAWRRRWRAEQPTSPLPEQASADGTAGVMNRVLLRQALAALPPRQRAVIVLRYAEDLSEREVADLLDCSVGSVKSQASRGLRRLKAMPGLALGAPTEPGIEPLRSSHD
jgi:RNA polymerase sigma-70 factor (sigma-E family)